MLAESLILSRINYGTLLYKNAPAYLIKHIQRLQNTATGYVLMHYSNEKDVISLNWLPIIEFINFQISKLTYKVLYNESWPNYLSLNRKKFIRDLRNSNSNMIERSKKNQTFHDNAENVFNKLPLSIREKSNYKIFCSMTKKLFLDKGLTIQKLCNLCIIVMYQLHITLYLF